MKPCQNLLTATALCFGYGMPNSALLFDDLRVALPPGITLVCGDESSGKTSLLRLLAGELALPVDGGELQVGNFNPAHNRPAYRRQVAWLDAQSTALDAQTARQIFSNPPSHLAACDADRLHAHIAGLYLEPHLDKSLTMLSSGTRRKVLLAAVLAAQAPVVLLDQPFMALDRPSIDYLLAVLASAAAAGAPCQAWVVADYQPPPGVPLAGTVLL